MRCLMRLGASGRIEVISPYDAVTQAQLRAILERLGVAQLDNLAVHGLNRPEHLAWASTGPGRELLANPEVRAAYLEGGHG